MGRPNYSFQKRQKELEKKKKKEAKLQRKLEKQASPDEGSDGGIEIVELDVDSDQEAAPDDAKTD